MLKIEKLRIKFLLVITTLEFDRLAGISFDERLKRPNLAINSVLGTVSQHVSKNYRKMFADQPKFRTLIHKSSTAPAMFLIGNQRDILALNLNLSIVLSHLKWNILNIK